MYVTPARNLAYRILKDPNALHSFQSTINIMDSIENGKSLLLKHLLNHDIPAQIQSRIIIDLFSKSYRVPSSVFKQDEKLDEIKDQQSKQAERDLKDLKKCLHNVVKKIDKTEAGETAEKFREPEVAQVDKIVEEWHSVKERYKTKLTKLDQIQLTIDKSVENLRQHEEESLKMHQAWIESSISLLRNLEKDIKLVQKVGPNEWNHTILKEVLHLIWFLYEFFVSLPGKLRLPQHVDQDFQDTVRRVEKQWALLVNRLRQSQQDEVHMAIQDAGAKEMVSAKTIRELYILNELSRRALEGRLVLSDKSNIQQKAKDIGKIIDYLLYCSRLTSLRNRS
jgi:hypothetical protein